MAKTERWTNRARRALSLAQENTEIMMADKIGTGHLILGLLEDTEGVLHDLLTDLGFEKGRIANVIEPRYEKRPFAMIDLSKDVKKALNLAEKEATRLGQQTVYPEHILLALTIINDHETQLAFATVGLTVSQVRDKILGAIANRNSSASNGVTRSSQGD